MKMLPLLFALAFSVPAEANRLQWALVKQSVTGADLVGVIFTSTKTGFACGTDGTVLRTVDGGRKWARIHRGKAGWTSLAARSGIVAVAGHGFVAVSPDGGGSFTETAVPGRVGLTSVAVAPDGSVWCCGMAGAVFHSRDRGATWEAAGPGLPVPFTAIAVTEAGLVVAGALNGMWLRGIAGKWSPLVSGEPLRVFGITTGPGNGIWLVGLNRDHLKVFSSPDITVRCDEFADAGDIEERGPFRIAVAPHETVWISGFSGSLAQTGGGDRIFNTEELPCRGTAIRAVTVAPDGSVWAAGAGGTLVRGVDSPLAQ